MRTINDHLTKYAEYHRDRRNIATHFIGIPMIVAGVAGFLARPQLEVAGIALAPVYFAVIATLIFYFLLDFRFAIAMTGFMAAATWAGLWMGAQSTSTWLWSAGSFFVIGWAFQFVGHIMEGRKPAFVDDLAGFLIGPLFIVAEWAFALGLRKDLYKEITDRAGPTRNHKPERATAA